MEEKEFQGLVLEQFKQTNNQLAEIKEDTEITRDSVNALIEWAEVVGERLDVRFPMKNS